MRFWNGQSRATQLLGEVKAMDRKHLDATGYSEREILHSLKLRSKNYRSATNVP